MASTRPRMPMMRRIVPVTWMSRTPKISPALMAYLRMAPTVIRTIEVPMPMGATGLNWLSLDARGRWAFNHAARAPGRAQGVCHDEGGDGTYARQRHGD